MPLPLRALWNLANEEERARALSLHGAWLVTMRDFGEARRCHSEALALCAVACVSQQHAHPESERKESRAHRGKLKPGTTERRPVGLALEEAAIALRGRLISLFLPGHDGRRPGTPREHPGGEHGARARKHRPHDAPHVEVCGHDHESGMGRDLADAGRDRRGPCLHPHPGCPGGHRRHPRRHRPGSVRPRSRDVLGDDARGLARAELWLGDSCALPPRTLHLAALLLGDDVDGVADRQPGGARRGGR